MGMFDYIRCKMPLPQEPAPPAIEWHQTKDTSAQYLEKYTIEADGRLIHHKPDDAWKFDEFTDVEVPYHGDISFGHYNDKTGEDWEYIARFTEGRCVRVWLDEYAPPKAREREGV